MELLGFYLFFCATCVLLALAPGPDNLAAITIAAAQGRKAALRFVSGLCCGLLVHTTLVVTGVAVLIKSQAWLLFSLKLFGAGYLIYLAWQSLRASKQSLLLPEQGTAVASVFKRGVLMSISNPKLLLFFSGFFTAVFAARRF